jgi:hypothetical protein
MNRILKISSLALYTFFALSLHAATYYVASSSSTPAGSDSNAGTQAAPWLTIQHAVNSMACGDTLIVVADGNFVAGDSTLPYFANCGSTTTVQSSALANFAPIGYRTNPAMDGPNYGKLSFTSGGIVAQPVVATSNYVNSVVQASFDGSANTVTITGIVGITSGLPFIADGLQVEFEPNSEGLQNYNFPAISMPSGLSYFTHYCVSGSTSGGAPNTTFQLKAADCSGSIIPLGSCSGNWCTQTVSVDPSGPCTAGQVQYNPTTGHGFGCTNPTAWSYNNSMFINAVLPVSVSVSANTLTIPNNYGSGTLVNNTPAAFAAAGFQNYGTLPNPLQPDTIYYTQSVASAGGNAWAFKVSTVPGGPPITLTGVGTGWVNMSSTNMPNNWAHCRDCTRDLRKRSIFLFA